MGESDDLRSAAPRTTSTKFIAFLTAHGVEFVVVGAYALAVHDLEFRCAVRIHPSTAGRRPP
jgi:hypothetical protein